MTRENFKKGMLILKESFPERFGEMTRTQLKIWFALLSDLDDVRWERAVLWFARNAEKPPAIAGLRKVATGTHNELEAEEAWGLVTRAVRSDGRYSTPQFSEQAVSDAVNVIGWVTICDCEIDGLGALRAHFFRVYKAVQTRRRIEREYKALDDGRIVGLLPQSSAASVKGLR